MLPEVFDSREEPRTTRKNSGEVRYDFPHFSMEEMQTAVLQLQQQMQALMAKLNQKKEEENEIEMSEDDDPEMAEMAIPDGRSSNRDVYLSVSNWESVLGGDRRDPTQTLSKDLVNLLEKPPPLNLLKSDSINITPHTKIPITPSSRKHILDQKMYIPQKKLEQAMHHLAHSLETQDPQGTQVAAAYVRSAWEDLHQSRRDLLAGRQKYKLEKREDDNRARLLTKEEEAKIQQTPRFPKGKSQGYPRHGVPSRQDYQQGGRGKGKGKGRKASPTRATP